VPKTADLINSTCADRNDVKINRSLKIYFFLTSASEWINENNLIISCQTKLPGSRLHLSEKRVRWRGWWSCSKWDECFAI